MRRFLFPWALGFFALSLFCAPQVEAQPYDGVPDVTSTYAIENARVVQAPGQVLDRATVVVREGQIMAVGTDVAIPTNAKRIAGDSLTVYAGFIDGLSHAGIPRPRTDPRDSEDVDDPGNPPRDIAGIQPDRQAHTMLNAADKSLTDLREAGFTVAHTVPHGRMLPGAGALILTAGETAEDLVLRRDVALYAQYEGGDDVYPETPMAIMAKLRQLYREAERRQRIETLYASNASGMERPDYSAEHYALFPVLNGSQPVMFYTDSALETYRTLALQEDLGFPLLLAGLYGAMDATDAVEASGAPVFLSTVLPEADDEPDSLMVTYDPTLRTASQADVEAEVANLKARVRQERQRYYQHAAMLHERGIPFGFSTKEAKPGDVKAHLRTMIEHGLPEDAALAALTTTPAEILGLSQSMGTVETGKMANLVVTTGPYFDEDSRVAWVFVDGVPYELEDEPRRVEAGGALVNPVGEWRYEVNTPQGDFPGVITFDGSRDDLRGAVTSAAGDAPQDITDVSVNENTISFAFDGGSMGRIMMTVTLFGDELEGNVSVSDMGTFAVTGTRLSGPNR